MSLIKVLDIGFGLTGSTLDITIAIPKDTYLYSFRVYNNKDVADTNCSDSAGTDYIELYVEQGFSRKVSFHKVFGDKIDTYSDHVDGKEYDVYKFENGEISVKVSQKDLTFVYMELMDSTAETCSDTKLIEPLFNLTPMRLAALDSASQLKDSCNIPRAFINKVLQIKAIEVALCCGAFCGAAKYWNIFYGKGIDKTIKKCGCHGGVA